MDFGASDSDFATWVLGCSDDGIENGFEEVRIDELEEKGFAELIWDDGFAPKSISPIWVGAGDG